MSMNQFSMRERFMNGIENGIDNVKFESRSLRIERKEHVVYYILPPKVSCKGTLS